jgi:peptidoglycan/LPS O-acetylase OafA/YrhL
LVIFAVHPLVLWLGACTVAKGWVARLMEWLGAVSYGVYILHIPIFMWLESAIWLLTKFHPRLAGRIDSCSAFIVLPAAFFAAHVLTKWLEAPVRKWLWGKYAQVFAAG